MRSLILPLMVFLRVAPTAVAQRIYSTMLLPANGVDHIL